MKTFLLVFMINYYCFCIIWSKLAVQEWQFKVKLQFRLLGCGNYTMLCRLYRQNKNLVRFNLVILVLFLKILKQIYFPSCLGQGPGDSYKSSVSREAEAYLGGRWGANDSGRLEIVKRKKTKFLENGQANRPIIFFFSLH